MTLDTATVITVPSAYCLETVLSVRHWSDGLFSFRCTRSRGFRFEAGQFTMIGLLSAGKPLVRAYSMVSAPGDDHLEFLSVAVPHGALTSQLRKVRVGDEVLVGKKAVGSLTLGSLHPGGTLWMLGTGTGLAPFMSILHTPEVYERYERIVLSHTVRAVSELAYAKTIEALPEHDLLGDYVGQKLLYYPSVTREAFATTGRITDHIRSGRVFSDLNLERLHPERDRVMLCGSEAMNAECKQLLEAEGFTEGCTGERGSYVLEKAFVSK
ncbi:MAG: ferredoxin--NADP reductase [Polyangiales bacterium]